MSKYAVDGNFGTAVRAAANGKAEALQSWLRSDEPIGAAERDWLADLLGQLAARPILKEIGRPAYSTKYDYKKQQEAVAESDRLVREGTKKYLARKEVIDNLKLRIDDSTFRLWVMARATTKNGVIDVNIAIERYLKLIENGNLPKYSRSRIIKELKNKVTDRTFRNWIKLHQEKMLKK